MKKNILNNKLIIDSNGKNKASKSAQTRSRIFETALSIMMTKGYEQTTVREICKNANVSIGTFYFHFPTKNDIFFDIFKQGDVYLTKVAATQLQELTTAKEKIQFFFMNYARLCTETGIDLMKIMLNPSNEYFVKYKPMQIVLENIIIEGQQKNEIRNDIKPNEIVKYLFVVARGCCYDWCTYNGNFDLETRTVQYICYAYQFFIIDDK